MNFTLFYCSDKSITLGYWGFWGGGGYYFGGSYLDVPKRRFIIEYYLIKCLKNMKITYKLVFYRI